MVSAQAMILHAVAFVVTVICKNNLCGCLIWQNRINEDGTPPYCDVPPIKIKVVLDGTPPYSDVLLTCIKINNKIKFKFMYFFTLKLLLNSVP